MDPRQSLPAVDRLLADPALAPALDRWQRRVVVQILRDVLAAARAGLAAGRPAPEPAALLAAVLGRLERLARGGLRRVINATGVVVHTNLGRAPLTPAASAAASAAAGGYCDLEYELETGERGHRGQRISELLALELPGSSSLVVNNNAASVLLVLNTLALGMEVPISRGELIEIGGSFRIPQILERSGARLVEVGTTNRTHLEDYETVLGADTGMILKVWPSNYRVVGFTRSVELTRLAALGSAHGVPVVADQGCGRLHRDDPGPDSEPSVEQLLAQGADLVCFSGDKMLGGPQAGLIVGKGDLVRRCARNPLARALRPDKMTLAALDETLRGRMLAGNSSAPPVARMLGLSPDELRARARALARRLRRAAPGVALRVEEASSRVGGGAAPEEDLPTWIVSVDPEPLGASELLDRLRRQEPPVVARAAGARVLFDPRTLLDGEENALASALAASLRGQDELA